MLLTFYYSSTIYYILLEANFTLNSLLYLILTSTLPYLLLNISTISNLRLFLRREREQMLILTIEFLTYSKLLRPAIFFSLYTILTSCISYTITI